MKTPVETDCGISRFLTAMSRVGVARQIFTTVGGLLLSIGTVLGGDRPD